MQSELVVMKPFSLGMKQKTDDSPFCLSWQQGRQEDGGCDEATCLVYNQREEGIMV